VIWAVYASFRPSTVTSRWLAVKWRHFRVTSGHLKSRDVISCHVTASYSVLQPCRKWNVQYASFRPSTATYRWLPVKWHHFWVTSDHLRSRDVISCHVTASTCELQPCRKWNVQYMRVFGPHSHFLVTTGQMTSLKGYLRWNKITWRQFLSRDCLVLRATGL